MVGTNMFSMEVKVIDNTDEAIKALKLQLAIGLAAVGEEMEGKAKDGCPVDTGRLRDSIVYVTQHATGNSGPMAVGDDSAPRGTPDEYEVQVGTNVVYAPYQEFGDNMSHKTGGAHFLRNAASSNQARYKALLEAALKM